MMNELNTIWIWTMNKKYEMLWQYMTGGANLVFGDGQEKLSWENNF